MIIIILVLSWTILTAQTRDDRIKEVITSYIDIITAQSNVISAIEYELYTTQVILSNYDMVLETEREINHIDIKLERVNSGKKFILGTGIGATGILLIGGLLKYLFR